MDNQFVIDLTSFIAGTLVALIGVFSKYFFDYRIARRELQIKERESITAVLGSSVPKFIRSTRDLYTRLSNFFEDPDKASKWLKPARDSNGDGYYLHEFVRRLFNFIALGRVTQDAINSLPSEAIKERSDLKKIYVFIDLTNSILTYTWLFKGFDNYDDERQRNHLFTGNLESIAEEGVRLWKKGNESIDSEDFNELYASQNPMILTLRSFISQVSDEKSEPTLFVVARFAILRAILAAFLSDYEWTMKVPEKQEIINELLQDLNYVANLDDNNPEFVDLVPENLKELMKRYNCLLF